MPRSVITAVVARIGGGTLHNRTIGTNADAVSFDNAFLSSMWCAPIRLPDDLDPTYPANVYADLAPDIDNATSGYSAILQVNATICPENGPWLDHDAELALSIPNPWSILDTLRVTFDDGSGVTFPAGILTAGAVLGLRLKRLPADARDNYPRIMPALACLTLDYHRRCQRIGVC